MNDNAIVTRKRSPVIILSIYFCSENVCFLTSAAYIQRHFRLDFIMEANIMESVWTLIRLLPWEQSDLGPSALSLGF